MWLVYFLRCADGSLYAGITTDLAARLALHNAGRGAKYTRSRLPVSLAYAEDAGCESDARKREHALKRMAKAEKEALVLAYRSAHPEPNA